MLSFFVMTFFISLLLTLQVFKTKRVSLKQKNVERLVVKENHKKVEAF